jgi:glyoxylate carboligase
MMIVKVTATIDSGFISENKRNIAVFLKILNKWINRNLGSICLLTDGLTFLHLSSYIE